MRFAKFGRKLLLAVMGLALVTRASWAALKPEDVKYKDLSGWKLYRAVYTPTGNGGYEQTYTEIPEAELAPNMRGIARAVQVTKDADGNEVTNEVVVRGPGAPTEGGNDAYLKVEVDVDDETNEEFLFVQLVCTNSETNVAQGEPQFGAEQITVKDKDGQELEAPVVDHEAQLRNHKGKKATGSLVQAPAKAKEITVPLNDWKVTSGDTQTDIRLDTGTTGYQLNCLIYRGGKLHATKTGLDKAIMKALDVCSLLDVAPDDNDEYEFLFMLVKITASSSANLEAQAGSGGNNISPLTDDQYEMPVYVTFGDGVLSGVATSDTSITFTEGDTAVRKLGATWTHAFQTMDESDALTVTWTPSTTALTLATPTTRTSATVLNPEKLAPGTYKVTATGTLTPNTSDAAPMTGTIEYTITVAKKPVAAPSSTKPAVPDIKPADTKATDKDGKVLETPTVVTDTKLRDHTGKETQATLVQAPATATSLVLPLNTWTLTSGGTTETLDIEKDTAGYQLDCLIYQGTKLLDTKANLTKSSMKSLDVRTLLPSAPDTDDEYEFIFQLVKTVSASSATLALTESKYDLPVYVVVGDGRLTGTATTSESVTYTVGDKTERKFGVSWQRAFQLVNTDEKLAVTWVASPAGLTFAAPTTKTGASIFEPEKVKAGTYSVVATGVHSGSTARVSFMVRVTAGSTKSSGGGGCNSGLAGLAMFLALPALAKFARKR